MRDRKREASIVRKREKCDRCSSFLTDGQLRPWSSGIGKLSNLSSQYCLTPNYFTSIIFGDREEEEPKQGISCEDQMRKLEAKQREKEGCAPLGADMNKPQAPPVASPGTSN